MLCAINKVTATCCLLSRWGKRFHRTIVRPTPPTACLQSTKLCVFEERVLEIVAATRHLPGNLATTGAV